MCTLLLRWQKSGPSSDHINTKIFYNVNSQNSIIILLNIILDLTHPSIHITHLFNDPHTTTEMFIVTLLNGYSINNAYCR